MKKKIEHQIINGVEHKWCNACKQWKPLENFSKDSSKWDGLQRRCKECDKQYYANKREEKLLYQKNYANNHKEEKSVYDKQYREDNAERISTYKKQWRIKWYATIEGYVYEIRSSNLRRDRKTKRCGADEDPLPPLEYYIEQFTKGIDYYDGKEYPFNELGFDRMDDSKPHTIDNMVVATTKHNIDRHHKQMTVEEYKEYIQNKELELILC